jgi:hypothetical protein
MDTSSNCELRQHHVSNAANGVAVDLLQLLPVGNDLFIVCEGLFHECEL